MSDGIKNLLAAGPKLIIEIEPIEKTSEGGIVLTEETVRREQDTVSEGILAGIGEIAFEHMCPSGNCPKIGDKVYFIKFAGKEIRWDGKYYRIINDEDVYAYSSQQKKGDK